ncbi:MAG: nicotinate-nucleotide adenylyltransferase [Dehalococcoidia bacterium]|nr:nicotinate-nucleotide adenylyltransferase [Dehalococcoidia bacterium]MCL4232149.1 nicotinate-nucleotide adenylyltransferase [Dehalococcoidia bacterium]
MSAPLVLVGGTFDPPHVGHLLMAECARWQSAAREARFIPAGDPYRKAGREVSSAGHRLAMTRLAILHNDAFTVDDREVRRSGPSYTVDTLEEYHAEGERDLALVIGIDALADMPAWKTPARIGELARLLVALKGEDASALGPLARAAGLARAPEPLDMPALGISGTLIRERVRAGKPIRYLVSPAVAGYIEEHGLYR